jgi:4'-phosphopantetheinyl transferase
MPVLPLLVRWAAVPAFAGIVAAAEALDAEERARAARFAYDADRDAFVAAHLLLRSTLAGVLGVEAAAVRFVRSPNGRPELADAGAQVRFSLTHTRALVACAIGPAIPLGIDAEAVAPLAPDAQLVRQCCAAPEQVLLAQLPGDRRALAFAQLWTTKEAVLKALGTGLNTSPAEVECALDPPRVVRAPAAGDAGGWFVWTHAPRPELVLTLAAYAAHAPREPDVAEWRGVAAV